ncbi:hypothetical protein [Legionella waltersii]|uniref:23, 7 kDa protein n=1 Tax=Legionella waltersii TaxID=66969 RepID=A0A0W1A2C9_9GAMM|nr:hypothetical protein [Legionella waltersii]KTD75171.1 23, 7 kDa protein [Legionella waltersii]SNV04684.1 Integral membrane protein (PIN domain superfamily) [Legionella waltersii]
MGKFFSTATKESDVDDRIQQAKLLLNKKSTEQQLLIEFMAELEGRVNQFKTELLSKRTGLYEKEQILKQYSKFANTLMKCVKFPEQADQAIESYLNNSYYPVAVNEYIKPNPAVTRASWLGLGLGVALLLASLPLFALNPIVGAVMLAIAVTVLLPSLFILLAPDSPDVVKKKEEERLLFKNASLFADPSISSTNVEAAFRDTDLTPAYLL